MSRPRWLVYMALAGVTGCGQAVEPAPAAPMPSAGRTASTASSVPTVPAPGSSSASALNSDGTRRVLPPSHPSEPPFTLVLRYDDFGPPSMASGLLGVEWWQWEPGGSYEIDDRFDVRVVVYRGRSRTEVAARYPTVKAESDHRLVERDAALRFLDEQLRGLPTTQAEDELDLGPLRRTLVATRASIVAALGELGR